MRIGTVIFFILVLIFFAGILLQSNIQVSGEIRELKVALSNEQAKNQTLQTQNQELSATVLAQNETIATNQGQIEALRNQIETLTLERDTARTEKAQTQQAHTRLQELCDQTNPFATTLMALLGPTGVSTLQENALPGILILFLTLTGASGGGWYWWHHTHRPHSTAPAPTHPDEVWVRMTRQQARQFARVRRR